MNIHPNQQRRFSLKKTAAAFKLAGTSAVLPASALADWIYNPPVWNGVQIYLSPARHSDTGMRGECASDENTLSQNVALGATGGSGGNLLDRQYRVRVGNGTISSAIANSNAWGADAHIPIHTNAAQNPPPCSSSLSAYGTWVIHWHTSTPGSILAQALVNRVGPASPGTNDFKCKNPTDSCTTITLAELQSTVAPAAYLETEFHTWNTGVNWLQQTNWKWRIGQAVDDFFGTPRVP